MSVVYYVPAENGDLLVATMAQRAKAKAVARNGKVSLCVLDETWPFTYLQVYCDAVIDDDGETLVDVMMAVLNACPVSRWARTPAHSKAMGERKAGCCALSALRHVRDATPSPAPQ